MKKLLLNMSIVACSLAATQCAWSAEYALDGYYRIQNMRDSKFVQVSGPFTARPDQQLTSAITQPGSVFFIQAVQDVNNRGEQAFRIVHLRSQGIDVVGDEGYTYEDLQNDLMNDSNLSLDATIVHSLTNIGFQRGYVNVGKAAMEFMIYFMGTYLNDNYKNAVNSGKPDVDLVALTKDFITNVAEKLNFNLYLSPVKTADGTDSYRLYYDVPNLQPVCDWYLNGSGSYGSNKEVFEVGFAAMRYGLEARGISTGEYLDDNELAEMAAGGYVLDDKFKTDLVMIEGVPMWHVPYEQIFSDADLLFAWLKLHACKLLDPDRCPKVSLMGVYLPDVGRMLREHRLTAQLLSYLPRLKTDKRICLISGLLSDGGVEGSGGTDYTANGEFGFISEESAIANYAADADKWNVVPVDTDGNYFSIATGSHNYTFDAETEFDIKKLTSDETFDMTHHNAEFSKRESEQGYYVPLYLDFPVKSVDDKVKFYTLTNEAALFDGDGSIMSGNNPSYPALTRTLDGTQAYYYELTPVDGTLPALTPVIAVCRPGNMLEIDYPTIAPDFNIAAEEINIPITDDEVAVQHAHRRAAETATGINSVLKGTLLPVSTDLLTKYGYDSYDATDRPIYSLRVNSGDRNARLFSEKTGTTTANEAFLLAPLGDSKPAGDTSNIYIGMPQDKNQTTGIENVAIDSNVGENVIFDLYGRRVQTMQPGNIYIVNGHKVAAK